MQFASDIPESCKRSKIFHVKHYLFVVFSIIINKLSSRNLNLSVGSSVVNFSDFDKNKIFVHIWRRIAPEWGISAGWNFFHLKYHSFKALSPIFRKFKWGTNFFYYCQLLTDFGPFFGSFFILPDQKMTPTWLFSRIKWTLGLVKKLKKVCWKIPIFVDFRAFYPFW